MHKSVELGRADGLHHGVLSHRSSAKAGEGGGVAMAERDDGPGIVLGEVVHKQVDDTPDGNP